MIDHINALKTNWYISPPWGKTIPPVEVNLLERVYLRTTRAFGYCSGVQWKHECWLYTVICGNEIVHATEYQIIGTGQLEPLNVQKPAFVSTIGKAVEVAEGEPFWNEYLSQWKVWVNFASGCKSVICDWLVAV